MQTAKIATSALGALLLVTAVPTTLHALDDVGDDAGPAPEARTMYVWTSTVGANNAKTANWGNVTPTVSRVVRYEGDGVLSMPVRNEHEGVRFDLNPPVDINPYKQAGFMRMRLRFRDQGGGMGGAMGGGADGAARPGGRNRNRPRGGGGGGGAGGFGGGGGGFGGGGGTTQNDDGLGGFGAALPADPATRERLAQLAPLPPLGTPTQGGGGGLPAGPGGGFPQTPGLQNAAAPTGPPPQSTTLKHLFVTLVMENGVAAGELPVNLQRNRADEDGWRLFVLPFRNMNFTGDANGQVKRIVVTGDNEDTVYLAQMALVIETGRMTVSVRRPSDPPGAQIAEVTVKPGLITLVADVEAGAADPEITWSFDADNLGILPPAKFQQVQPGGDTAAPAGGGAPGGGGGGALGGAGDGAAAVPTGPRIDAKGMIARFDYPNEEQNYRVEVTVRDRSGKKKQVTASILVKVRG